MSAFVITKRFTGDFKFAFSARKGKIIFTGLACRQKDDCAKIIAALIENPTFFTLTKVRASGGKFFFRLTKDGLVLVTSRKFTTELLMQKGIDSFLQTVANAEILDFSESEYDFGDETPAEAEEIFG